MHVILLSVLLASSQEIDTKVAVAVAMAMQQTEKTEVVKKGCCCSAGCDCGDNCQCHAGNRCTPQCDCDNGNDNYIRVYRGNVPDQIIYQSYSLPTQIRAPIYTTPIYQQPTRYQAPVYRQPARNYPTYQRQPMYTTPISYGRGRASSGGC